MSTVDMLQSAFIGDRLLQYRLISAQRFQTAYSSHFQARLYIDVVPIFLLSSVYDIKEVSHQQIGFKFKEETSEFLNLDCSSEWCRNLDT